MYPLIVNLIKLSPWELVLSLWSFLWEDYSFRMQTVKMKVNQIQQRKREVAGLAKASQDSHHVHSTWWVILPTSPYPTLFCQHKNYLQNKVGQLVTCGQSYTTSALVISDQMVKHQFTKSSHKNYAISDLAFRALAMLLKHNKHEWLASYLQYQYASNTYRRCKYLLYQVSYCHDASYYVTTHRGGSKHGQAVMLSVWA